MITRDAVDTLQIFVVISHVDPCAGTAQFLGKRFRSQMYLQNIATSDASGPDCEQRGSKGFQGSQVNRLFLPTPQIGQATFFRQRSSVHQPDVFASTQKMIDLDAN